jgi:chromosome partitioning protein
MRKILVTSAKGGAGKTTIATNLAAHYAQAGKNTALVDTDRLGSSYAWARKRPEPLPGVLGIDGGRRWWDKLPPDTQRVIVDSPAGVRPSDVEELLEHVDAAIVPILPSVIDLEATQGFVAGLVELAPIRRRKLPVALVANRTKPWTNATQAALETLRGFPFPVVAQLRDSQGYALLAGLGKSIFDYHSEQITSHQDDWQPLLKWLKKLG